MTETEKRILLNLYEKYKSGQTLQNLADFSGIKMYTLSRRFQKLGLQTRDRSNAAKMAIRKTRTYNKEAIYNSNGYLDAWVGHNQPRRAEHRVIMEKHLGRKLLPNEIVHHINNKRDDNRLKNLMVLSVAEHNHIHFPKITSWSRDYDRCLRCGDTRYKHSSFGYCTNCYYKYLNISKYGGYGEYKTYFKKACNDGNNGQEQSICI